MSLKSPSRLTIEAAGLQPIAPRKATQACTCAMCGYPIAIDDPVVPFEPGDSFMDYGALKSPSSDVIDGWCAAVWTREFMQTHSKSVICRAGVFSAASNNDIAWFLQNPHEGEWIFVVSDQKQQHLVWRAPVNISREIFAVQFGDLRLTIRRSKLIEGKDAAGRLAAALSEGRKGAGLKSPFARLSRKLDDPTHGLLNSKLYELAKTRPDVQADIDVISSLSAGELWGLTAVMYATSSTHPERRLPAA